MKVSAVYEDDSKYQRLLRHNKRLLDIDVLRSVLAIREAVENDDPGYAIQLWNELSIEEQIDLWIRESKGGVIPKSEQSILKP